MRVVIMQAYALISVYPRMRETRTGRFARRRGYRRAKLKCSSCGFTMFTVVTDLHSPAISVQAVGYSRRVLSIWQLSQSYP